ncbi:MAG: hypothetical protein HY897_03355 [Deltaproteobacteria bacterium]|nr:hypothetical protein [Deltaproteobacteria bacterium]
MAMLRGALHVHTTLSDGEWSPDEAAAHYGRLGFDFVAVTDHDYLLRPGAREAAPRERAGVLILPGVELTVHERGYVHVNEIRGAGEVLHVFNHPAEYNLPVDEVLAVAAAVSGRLGIDAIEVSNRGFYTPEFDDPRIPYPKVASDDSHGAAAAGRAWVEMECERDPDAIIRAIKAGRAVVRFK